MAMTLKACRANKGLSQAEAAKKIGIAIDTLSKYERGITFPDIPILRKIEEVYNVSYDDIIFLPEDYG